MSRTVAQALAAALQRHGVEHVFGQSIPSEFLLAAPEYGLRQVGYRTENAGGAMADGYARASGRVAVVTAQNGPAATLLVPPLAEALKASIPVVAIVQDVARAAAERNAFQELDHLALFQGCAKWARRLDVGVRLDDYVDLAFTAAASGRPGPAVLVIPVDVLAEPAREPRARCAQLGHYPLDRVAPDPDAVKLAADALCSARRPLLVAGGGVHLSGAAAEVEALSALCGIPVATTNMGKGAVDERGELAIGVIGNCMGPRSLGRHLRPLVAEADLVLLVGTRTNQNGTDSWRLLPRNARFIHVDIDGMEVGRNYEALRLVGDARLALRALHAELEKRDLSRPRARREAAAARIRDARSALQSELAAVGGGREGAVRPEHLMAELDRLLAPEDIVVADASYSTNWVATYLTARKAGGRFLLPRGLAGLGWGFPMALGAKLARPQARVVAVAGDGAFGHCWSELETARRMGIAVTLIVLNNGILGYQAHAENVLYGEHTSACNFLPVDHAAIARACGCVGERITRPEQFGRALQRALDAGETVLLDVLTDPRAFPPITFYEGKDPVAHAVPEVAA